MTERKYLPVCLSDAVVDALECLGITIPVEGRAEIALERLGQFNDTSPINAQEGAQIDLGFVAGVAGRFGCEVEPVTLDSFSQVLAATRSNQRVLTRVFIQAPEGRWKHTVHVRKPLEGVFTDDDGVDFRQVDTSGGCPADILLESQMKERAIDGFNAILVRLASGLE